jgi:dihydrofolate synthase/folylpolyglutamate synthase
MPPAASLTYSDALARLLSLGGELYTQPGQPRRKFDLIHMRALLSALGNPERRFPSVLIAGTNGKGSTAATLASILAVSGYSVGLYTSPHLARVNERIRISVGATGGAAVDDARDFTLAELEDSVFFDHLVRVEEASTGLVAAGALPDRPSFFETLTAIAMLAFAALPGTGLPVNIAILEVGMGGRLDATNVVEPLLSIITDISLDHTEWLGPSIDAIAREKAGILRPKGIMITLPQHPEANQALGEIAVELNVRGINAAVYLPGREASASSENRYELTGWPGSDGETLIVESPLRGRHQQRNLALAIAAAFALRDEYGYRISLEQIARGIRQTRWAGRLECLPAQPGRPPIVLDVAHNPAGAWALRAAIGQIESAGLRLLIFGCMRDKAAGEMAQILFPIFDHVYLTDLPSPRAASSDELAAAAGRTGVAFTLCPDPAAALKAATEASEAQPGSLIVAGGSVVLIGALRSLLL